MTRKAYLPIIGSVWVDKRGFSIRVTGHCRFSGSGSYAVTFTVGKRGRLAWVIPAQQFMDGRYSPKS